MATSSSDLGQGSPNTLPGPQKPTFPCPQIMGVSLFNEVRKGGIKWCCSINQKPPCQRDCHSALAYLSRSDSLPSLFNYFIRSIHFLKFLRRASLCAWYRECKVRKTQSLSKATQNLCVDTSTISLLTNNKKKWTLQERDIQTALNLMPLMLFYLPLRKEKKMLPIKCWEATACPDFRDVTGGEWSIRMDEMWGIRGSTT